MAMTRLENESKRLMKPMLALALTLLCVLNSASLGHGQSAASWEELFLSVPEAARCAEHLAVYTSVPHVAGTDGDWQTVEYTVEQLELMGFSPNVSEFEATVTYPISRSLKLIEPVQFTAGLQEAYIPVDPTSGDPRVIPTFNAYSATGDVTAPVVYVNYGQYSDYQTLLSLGVNLTGAIHIARYGMIFRGTKAMLAEMYGASGVLIYSDPADDGYGMGPVYPDGPWRPESGVQRGSASFLSLCPGDPTSDLCQPANGTAIQTMATIPIQPISWGDAYPILSNLGGQPVPEGWQGALNFTYHIGPGPAVANLNINTNLTKAKLWNVIVEIKGSGDYKDEYVLLGNHRDAWTFGGVDPNSGTAALLEVARAFSVLLDAGWTPNRTIVLASWDGEEYGLLGSTNWANQNAHKYGKKLIAYLNVDTAVAGIPTLAAGGTPSLAQLLRDVTEVVIDPNTNLPISQVSNFSFPLLGSGSDFTAYLDHLGIPSVDLSFSGDYGVYHSVYDSFHWMVSQCDPTFGYHRAMAQLWGLMALRIATTEIMPLNVTNGDYTASLYSSLAFTQSLLNSTVNGTTVDLTSLVSAIKNFEAATVVFNNSIPNTDPQTVNQVLLGLERYFLGPGLPGRPYYKHVLQAPGVYLGYNADPFPGVNQAIRDQDWDEVAQQLAILSDCIDAAANSLLLPASN